MATDFNTNAIISAGGFKPSTKDSPLDVRSRIATIDDITSIPNPYEGLIVYVGDTKKYYSVTSLADKIVGGITIKNAIVGSYIEFGASSDLLYEVVESNLEDITQ